MTLSNDKKLFFKHEELPLLPLRDIVIFPNIILPLLVGRSKSIKAVKDAQANFGHFIFLTTQKTVEVKEPQSADLYPVGVIAEILQVFKLPDGSIKILIEGKQRAKIDKFLPEKNFFKVKLKTLEMKLDVSLDTRALMRSVQSLFEEYVRLNEKVPAEASVTTLNIENPEYFTNMVASYLMVKITERQRILETDNLEQRLRSLVKILTAENKVMQVEKRIMSDVKKRVERAQKDFYLQEQLKVIEKELGRKDDDFKELEDLEKKVKKADMPKDARLIADRELKKLSRMMPFSPEATVSRNYLDWLINLPWKKKTKDRLDIKEAHKILEEDHCGLEKPKQRILEYLAVKKLAKKPGAQILCLVGPPGVGKTSLARSVAHALGRKFVRVSVGGVRDEAEIRGHRRTYIGALPGRIIQSIKKAGTKNPVFLLDEIDKMSIDFRGDPTSALLEVLDPEQNNSFSDHYIEAGFDLSEVMFITTSNVKDNIPLPLQDRMEVIKLAGYTDYEKLEIAKIFLLPKQIKACGLKKSSLKISDEVIFNIIRNYTLEAGVRNLERELSHICRKVARKIVEKNKNLKVEITLDNLHEFLGPPRFTDSKIEKMNQIGVAAGLAWTEAGGDIMHVETSILKGTGKPILTGKLGEVMQESARAALSYIRSRAEEFGLPENFYRRMDIHVHIPEGAIPKDGPSAGITMASAIISSLTKRVVRRDVAMTGEITLRGRVLPVGGLKSKILAAHRAGIKKVLIPKKNSKDLQEIPVSVKEDLDIVLVESMDEVINIALLPPAGKEEFLPNVSAGSELINTEPQISQIPS